MPLFDVEITATIRVSVEADDAQQAMGRAERFVEWMSPTSEQIDDYLTDHPEGIQHDTGSFDIVDEATKVELSNSDSDDTDEE